MPGNRPKKRKPEEISHPPKQLSLSGEDWTEFERGIDLFNDGSFWHAHEAWEEVWKRQVDDERVFFQGLIQLAAAYHHAISKRSYRGLLNNLDKAYEKLKVFSPEYLGVSVAPLLESIRRGRAEVVHQGADILEGFSRHNIPRISFHKPADPDLLVAMTEILTTAEFREGVRLFNGGYFWEAHEVWEELWRGQEGDAKTFLEGFVRLASAYNFLRLNRQDHTVYLLRKAYDGLGRFQQSVSGINLRPILERIMSTCRALENSGANGDRATMLRNVPNIQVKE